MRFIISVSIIFTLILSLAVTNTLPALAATPTALKWTGVNIPADGTAGGWVLASGSDIHHLAAASDGTLYAYVAGLTYTLYKSTDSGIRWSYIGDVQDVLKDIAVSPADPATVYYATASSVYKSSNGGNSFRQLPDLLLDVGETITSLTVTCLNSYIVAVGTAKAASSAYGSVYILDEEDIFADWEDTGIGEYDVYALDFAPNYAFNHQTFAVVTNETDTFVFNKTGEAEWNASTNAAVFNRNNSSPPASVVANEAVIAFPNDYSSLLDNSLYVGIKTGGGEGDAYRVRCTGDLAYAVATDLNCGSTYNITDIDITGLTAYSDGQKVVLLAGAAASCQAYISRDGGLAWTKSKKSPSGATDTEVLMASGFDTSGVIYAVTSGINSALSVSRDIGVTWNQISLIDTPINNIVDFVPSPASAQDNTLFMITAAAGQSLWRSMNDGLNWERIFYTDSSGANSLNLVSLPPEYGPDCQTVYVAGRFDNCPVIWASTDNGQNFQSRFTYAPDIGGAIEFDIWAIADENTLFLGSFDGAEGMIYYTTDGGYSYSQGTAAGNASLTSIALSPNFGEDGTILVGNSAGWIYRSTDSGASFQPLPADATASPLDGEVSVAFDPAFATNRTVYAASSTAGSGIYRFISGSSDGWEIIDNTLPSGATINCLSLDAGGTLYAANSSDDGGIERCLNPAVEDAVFETIATGLNNAAFLTGLWQRNNRLWSVDMHNNKLMTFYDSLVSPPLPVKPEIEAAGIGNLTEHTARNIVIDWEKAEGATGYEWQCSYDADFLTIPADFSGTTTASSVHLPPLDTATTYYWRVRAHNPILSPWSLSFSFTTCMDTEAVNLKTEVPSPGATDVSLKPVFQWTAVLGAEAYELLVATDPDFEHPVIVKISEYALKTNAWNCDVTLEYNTVYYWKVRATTASTSSAWSSVGIFTTESEPTVVLAPSTPFPTITQLLTQEFISARVTPTFSPTMSVPPSAPVPSTTLALLPDVPAWLIYLIAGLFSVVLMSLLIVLIIVIKIKS